MKYGKVAWWVHQNTRSWWHFAQSFCIRLTNFPEHVSFKIYQNAVRHSRRHNWYYIDFPKIYSTRNLHKISCINHHIHFLRNNTRKLSPISQRGTSFTFKYVLYFQLMIWTLIKLKEFYNV